MCFLLANASLNKISVLVTGACQSLVHFSFTHPFYVRTVYKRGRASEGWTRDVTVIYHRQKPSELLIDLSQLHHNKGAQLLLFQI